MKKSTKKSLGKFQFDNKLQGMFLEDSFTLKKPLLCKFMLLKGLQNNIKSVSLSIHCMLDKDTSVIKLT